MVCHAGLRRCHSPRRGLLETCRVARRALAAFEPRDALLIRALERLGFAQVYEALAPFRNDGHFGGVRDGEIPNFVHRWSEREVWKAVVSFAPHARPRIRFADGTDEPRIPGPAKGGACRLALRPAMPAGLACVHRDRAAAAEPRRVPGARSRSRSSRATSSPGCGSRRTARFGSTRTGRAAGFRERPPAASPA